MGSVRKQLERFLLRGPRLGRGVYVARGAVVTGDVRLGEHASVWFQAVLRGDINRIVVGARSNIQDGAVLHVAGDLPCVLGRGVTVGHGAIVHACRVGDGCLLGMGAVVLDGAVVGKESLVGARALVTQGSRFPAGSLILGAPARVARRLTVQERRNLKLYARHYVENAAYCLEHGINVGGPL